ncbi:MAG: valine--tRNA ligase, partial [Thermodesulfobacteriota bacterium]
MSTKELGKVYNPADVEDKWENWWIERGLFTASRTSDKPAFSMVIPPPNITGTLHLGHALNNTLQDILARYKRMTGFNVLWLPGIDHAGIATQNVVERQLHAEGKNRHEVGREEFIERVWKWKEESGGAIITQLKRLGASCDWSRQRFTMDEGLSKAVREVFVRLYKEGLIYRGDYIINWCPRCHTALSDLEVEAEEIEGKLYYMQYPFKDGGGTVTVATTRPETMLGDTAVAVNPEDARFASLIGKTLVLPIVDREIPVIADPEVDMEFGTGAVKITPAHDFNDFDMAVRHGLEFITVMDINAEMNENAGPLKGLDRSQAREAVIKEFAEKGLLAKIEPHKMMPGECYRCRTVVEPTLSKQWFVSTKELAAPAIEAVETGKTRFLPKNWENTYFDWMHNIRDWCISRQIWWGHRIPAWYCTDCDHVTVAIVDAEKCEECGSAKIEQDFDVLDTWFSSALWPFSTLGWPEETEELKVFYPTSALSTGFDIIFFWVARMMMMGLKFMGEVPFKDVYIHAMIRDSEGQKMSKSKGNVIDPLIMMDEFGTDAFRFTLAVLAAQGRDIKLAPERIEGYRNFANKIWNLTRFALMNVGEGSTELPDSKKFSMADKWIVARLGECATKVRGGIDSYRFDEAAKSLYGFVWHELCDWYVELSKKALYGDLGEEQKEVSAAVLLHVLKESLKMLHPFMPFMTEEIWSYLPGTEDGKSIMEEEFPAPGEEEEVPEMDTVMAIIGAVRNLRTEVNVQPGTAV